MQVKKEKGQLMDTKDAISALVRATNDEVYKLLADTKKTIKPPTSSGLVMDIKFPKKAAKKKAPELQRIVITGTTSWKKQITIAKYIKSLEPKTIDFIVTGTSRGVEQMVVSICKNLGIPVIQFHPWSHISNSSYLSHGKILKLFKPTLVLVFNEVPKENTSGENYEKLTRRADIEFKRISK